MSKTIFPRALWPIITIIRSNHLLNFELLKLLGLYNIMSPGETYTDTHQS